MMRAGDSARDGWWRRARRSKSARRRSAIAVLVVASIAGAIGIMFFLAMREDPPRLAVAASAVVDESGTARVVEMIDYRYTWSSSQGGSGRTGFLHVLSNSGSLGLPRLIDVAADVPVEVADAPQGDDLAVRVATPTEKGQDSRHSWLTGDHTYRIRSKMPLVTTGGHLSWDVLGRGWDDEIAGVAARLVGPWQLLAPTCKVVGVGPGYSCSVRSERIGELVVAAPRLPAGARLTVAARRGAAVTRPAARPVRVPDIGESDPLHWWQKPLLLGGLVLVAALLPGLVLGRVLRRLGRDVAPVRGFDPTNLPEPGGSPGVPGGVRVDDARLAAMATPVSAPPQGLEPWQGAVIRSEAPDDLSRIAWFLGRCAPGRLSFTRERGRDGAGDLVLVRSGPEATSTTGFDETLDLAFAGRSRVRLGRPDRDLATAWRTLEPLQLAWLLDAGLSDPHRARRVRTWRRTGALIAYPLFLLAVFATIFVGALGPLGGVALPVLAGLCGVALTFVLRAWELDVRTSLGSTWWVRTEAFRRYLAECDVADVIGIAERGQLAFFTTWAVALDVTAHWTATVAAADLPDDTAGLDLARSAPELLQAFRAVVYQADAQAEESRRSRERRQADRAAQARR